MIHGFHGGVRPADRKKATRRLPAVPLERGPAQVVLPLVWCAAQPQVLVRAGDRVLAGQKLALPREEGVPLHATVSGRVLELGVHAYPGGRGEAIVLESDGREEEITPEGPFPRADRPDELSPKEILDLIREGGVVDVDASNRPTYLRLKRAMGKAGVLLVNGVECEPYLTADHRLLLERPEAVLGGIRLMLRVLNLDTAVLAVGGDKGDAIAALQARLPLRGGEIRLAVLRPRCPLGAEKILVEQVTGRRVPPGGSPLDVGCLVAAPTSVAAVYDAVYRRRPLMRRIVTVAGGAVERPGNYLLPLGTRVEELLRETGQAGQPARVVLGGAMTGRALTDLSVPVGKNTAAVLALTDRECAVYRTGEGACLHCGRCVDVCPMHLEPLYLRAFGEAGRIAQLEEYHVEDCVECGACAYACPARINLVRSIRTAKHKLRTAREGGEAV